MSLIVGRGVALTSKLLAGERHARTPHRTARAVENDAAGDRARACRRRRLRGLRWIARGGAPPLTAAPAALLSLSLLLSLALGASLLCLLTLLSLLSLLAWQACSIGEHEASAKGQRHRRQMTPTRAQLHPPSKTAVWPHGIRPCGRCEGLRPGVCGRFRAQLFSILSSFLTANTPLTCARALAKAFSPASLT